MKNFYIFLYQKNLSYAQKSLNTSIQNDLIKYPRMPVTLSETGLPKRH